MQEGSDEKVGNDELLEMLLSNDDIDWKGFIRELVSEEKMDPWDIDVTVISSKFLELIGELKEMDFRLGGKMILAASFFLKLKSDRLLGEDMEAFDAMIVDDFDEFDDMEFQEPEPEPTLVPRSPQPRKRKVSIADLAHALESALKKEKKKQIRSIHKERMKALEDTAEEVKTKKRQRDIDEIIDEVFAKVKSLFTRVKKVSFDHLVKSEQKHHKVETFVPLLHLDNQGKVALIQEEPFGDIHVNMEEDI